MSGVKISTARGPWIAQSAVASDRSSSTARKPTSLAASSSLTTWAFDAFATTR